MQDHLGSTRLLTSSAGAVIATYTYDAYGNTTSHTGTAATPLLWAGQYQDTETGFYYLINRYYDPATAQFLTIDPAVSQTQAAYTYTSDSPLNATDPTGLCSHGLFCVAWMGIRDFLAPKFYGAEQLFYSFRASLCSPANQIALGLAFGGEDFGGIDGEGFAGDENGFMGSATAHGQDQLNAAGFDNTDVALIKAGNSYEQARGGGIAYVSQTGPDSYNMIVENDLGQIVTAHRGMTFKDLSGLARNYGWTGWP